MLNDRVGAYLDEDFSGIDPDQIDEVRDYLVARYNEWLRGKQRAQQGNTQGNKQGNKEQ